MLYSNPKIPEEINYSKENPLKEFAVLVAGVFLLLIALVVAVHLLAQHFAQHIPFEYEQKIIPSTFIKTVVAESDSQKNQPIYDYLTQLAQGLADKMDLPMGMSIQVAYVDDDAINAFATLDGLILINQGLLDYVMSENELAFVLAHEIAHIKERHPIKSLSSGILIGVVMSIITGSIDNNGAAAAVMTSTTLTSLKFSRSQESAADALALHALQAYYGHINGSQDFFTRLQEDQGAPGVLQFASTHPGMDERIEQIATLKEALPVQQAGSAKLIPVSNLVTGKEH